MFWKVNWPNITACNCVPVQLWQSSTGAHTCPWTTESLGHSPLKTILWSCSGRQSRRLVVLPLSLSWAWSWDRELVCLVYLHEGQFICICDCCVYSLVRCVGVFYALLFRRVVGALLSTLVNVGADGVMCWVLLCVLIISTPGILTVIFYFCSCKRLVPELF